MAAISEKDANIALLELSAPQTKASQEEVMALKREKDRLMYQLKQQVKDNHIDCEFSKLFYMIVTHEETHDCEMWCGDLWYVLLLTRPSDLWIISAIHRNPMNHHLYSPTHPLSFLLPAGFF